jgi:hypothetical protein
VNPDRIAPRHWRAALAAAAASAVTIVLAAVGCSGPGDAQPESNGDPAGDAVLENMVVRIYDENDLANIIRASSGVVDDDKGKADLEDVAVSFYDKGESTADLASRRGEVFLFDRPADGVAKSDFVLDGGVRYEDRSGTVMTVPRVRYSSQRQRLISSGGPFERRAPLENGTMLFTGRRFEMSKDMTELCAYDGCQVVESSPGAPAQ